MSNLPNFAIYIPARLDSSRLPRKLLLSLAGKPVICHTIDRAIEASPKQIVIVTDSDEIAVCVKDYRDKFPQRIKSKISIFKSLNCHDSGTDRIAEAAKQISVSATDIIVNLQGDEPLLPAGHILKVVECLSETNLLTATLSVPIGNQEAANPNVVKVVTTTSGAALYFSRCKIPYDRDEQINSGASNYIYQKHLGLYAYRGELLLSWPSIAESELELLEKLEQLRLLENGFGIQVAEVEEFNGVGIDTAEQLAAAELIIAEKQNK